MTPQDFQNYWTNKDKPLSPISCHRLDHFHLQKTTYNFLNIAGLPVYCEPYLNFANDSDDLIEGINKLTDQFDFLLSEPGYEKYITIGACRNGDIIAINTSDNDTIVQLDHEDSFNSDFFNSSIETLADFIILYRDFETEVLLGKDPDDNFQIYNFTDGQFDTLKNQMHLIDSRALTEKGFWKEELEVLLDLRKEYFPKRLFR